MSYFVWRSNYAIYYSSTIESCGFRLVDKAEILLEYNLILEVGTE